VRDYLVDSSVPINNVIARGFGKTRPIADNATAAGRKLNRRVEMIVEGDVIGTPIAPTAGGGSDVAKPDAAQPAPSPTPQ
jgi:hypothetical protein